MRALGTVGAPLQKPRPRLLDAREKAAILSALDKIERQKVRERSRGCCEMHELNEHRCTRTAMENHHMLGGMGRRNNGKSILAAYRIHLCPPHHREVTGHVLMPNQIEVTPTLRFRRVR